MRLISRSVLLILYGCAAVLAVISLGEASARYPGIWILPVAFMAVSSIVLQTASKAPSFPWLEYSLVSLWFARLVLIPALMLLAEDEYAVISPYPTPSEYRLSFIILAYEVLITGIVVILFLRRRRTPAVIKPQVAHGRGSYVLLAGLVVVGSLGFLLPEVRERFSFFLTPITATAREIVSGYDAATSSVASLTNLARLAMPALIITLAVKAYKRRPSLAVPLLATLGCLAVNAVYVATSRASFFISLAASLIVLALVFPRERRIIAWSGGIALALTTTVVTLNKSFSGEEALGLGGLANYLSVYLMGPKEYAVGLRAVDAYAPWVTTETVVNDVVGNVPIISGYADLLNRTSQFYNWTYLGANLGLGGGLIAPATVQGAFYVGWVISPLAAALALLPAVLGIKYLERAEQDPSLSYVAAFAVVFSLLFHTNSISTTIATLAYPIAPLLVLLWVDRLLGSKKKERRR